MKRVAVCGIGYVGCVTAACLARDGNRVIGVDVDRDKVAALGAGQTPVAEPGLDEMVRHEVAAGRLLATTDVEQAVRHSEIGIITVGTPSMRDGAVSTRAMERIVRAIGEVLRRHPQDYTVVVRSTLLPGILEERVAPLLAEAAGRELGPGLRICNNPEFLRESTAIADYYAPPFVVVGTVDDWHARDVLELYRSVPAEQIVTDSRTAAMLKYACNAFHALKIAFANEIGALARALGADGPEVMELLCRDTKLNVSRAYLRPGFAFGGSCLPKDLRAMTRFAGREGLALLLLDSILPSNQAHLRRAIEMVEEAGCRKIGVVGLSFKANTDDLRESPCVTLVETLVGRGYDIKIYDPGISLSQLRGRNLAYIDQHLPHLAALMVDTPEALQAHAELVLACTDVADTIEFSPTYDRQVIDLRKGLVMADAHSSVGERDPANV
jgi:GDP-mannose 6-dehydrogenase